MRANLYMVIFTTHFLSSLISARQIFDRIVNGQAATQGQFPYQVSMCYNHIASFNQAICDTQCGGSIFNETTIITAAHCCWDSWVDYPSRYMIVAGELDSVHTSGLEQFRTVKSIKIHPNYNSNVFPYNQHDICLLTLDSPLVFNENVNRIYLDEEDPVVDTTCQVSGWGQYFVSIQTKKRRKYDQFTIN